MKIPLCPSHGETTTRASDVAGAVETLTINPVALVKLLAVVKE
jgi:hypothetical protein